MEFIYPPTMAKLPSTYLDYEESVYSRQCSGASRGHMTTADPVIRTGYHPGNMLYQFMQQRNNHKFYSKRLKMY